MIDHRIVISSSSLWFCIYLCIMNIEKIFTVDFAFQYHLGSTTPYRLIANEDVSELSFPGCIPVKLWTIIRHGTRTPGRRTVESQGHILELQKKILRHSKNGSISDNLYSQFEAWTPFTEMKDIHKLTPEGEEEHRLLGKRYRRRFAKLLPKFYSSTGYLFQHTATQRTELSAKYFAEGLFGPASSMVLFQKHMGEDPLLRFYKLCPKWNREVKKSGASKRELRTFESSKFVKKTISKIGKKLGFADGSLVNEDVWLMYMVCGYETAWDKGNSSPWCEIFDEDDFETLEYAADLKFYWRDGYAFDIIYKPACVLLKDIIQRFRDPNSQKAVFYFTHSGTILKLLTRLGLYKDVVPLKHDNFEDMRHSRKWRTSKIDSFASNLVFVLFKCEKELMVLTMHQEKAVILPGCPTNTVLCPLKVFESVYRKSVMECDFNKICEVEEPMDVGADDAGIHEEL